MKYWLINRDPYNGLLLSPYNWVVVRPFYTANNHGFGYCSYSFGVFLEETQEIFVFWGVDLQKQRSLGLHLKEEFTQTPMKQLQAVKQGISRSWCVSKYQVVYKKAKDISKMCIQITQMTHNTNCEWHRVTSVQAKREGTKEGPKTRPDTRVPSR